MRKLLFFILLFALTFTLSAHESYKIKAIKVNEKLNIDGKLDEPVWQSAEKVDLNYEIQIWDNAPALQKTTAMVLYDEQNLYFGFICYDTNPGQIRAHITDRDKIWEDDFVILIIDTYGDNQNAYQFAVNPYGIQGDGIRSGNREDMSFDLVWYSAGIISDSGWTVEIAIPFKSLRFPQKKGHEWNVMIGRNYPRESRYIFSWTPFDKNNPCLLCQAGKLTGLDEIPSISFVELLPYAMSYQDGYLPGSDPSQDFKNEPVKIRSGVGVKFSPNPETTIEGVLNPDFSQVETDVYQISVNTTHALYYPEKRPFFLEGMEVYQSPLNIFYSRMINNPLYALKFKTKTGRVSLAYLSSFDKKTLFIVPGEERSSTVSTSMSSLVNVARARYDFGEQSYAGLFLTGRNLTGAYNYVGGFDWNLFFWRNYYFRGQFIYSLTRELNKPDLFSTDRKFGETGYTASFDGEKYGGYGMTLRFMKFAKYHEFEINYRDFSPTFQSNLGFITRSNLRLIHIENRFNFYPRGAVVDLWELLTNFGFNFNHSGARKERWIMLGLRAQLKGQTQIFMGFLPVNEEVFSGRKFVHMRRTFANVYSTPFRFLSLSLNFEYGRKIYRTSEPKLGFARDFNLNVRLKPTDKIEISSWYSKARLEDDKTGELFYDGYVTGVVGIYQFNPNLFVRLITQYDSFSGSIQFFPLLSFKLNPFTIFYFGSTIDMLDFGSDYGIKRLNQEIFLKVQYLWRN